VSFQKSAMWLNGLLGNDGSGKNRRSSSIIQESFFKKSRFKIQVVNFYSIGVYIITDIYSPHGKTRTKIKVY
jgi:hypothetical protein